MLAEHCKVQKHFDMKNVPSCDRNFMKTSSCPRNGVNHTGTIQRRIPCQKTWRLQLQLEELIDETTDKVYIFPMSRGELQQTALLGQAFDKKLVTDEIRALFF